MGCYLERLHAFGTFFALAILRSRSAARQRSDGQRCAETGALIRRTNAL